jgi:glycosyltransferase involved in cell wall biosynthesis
MKLAYICISHKPINRATTGGIETFSIYLLPRLQELGCDVTLFAARETDLSLFPKINFVPVFSLDDLQKEENENTETKKFALNYVLFQYAGFMQAYNNFQDFDVIHYSSAQWYLPLVLSNNKKHHIVTTVHVNNLKDKPFQYVLQNFSGVNIANISQTSSALFTEYKNKRVVYNGIDMSLFPFEGKGDDYFAWFGRISPQKGLKEAVLAAKKADVKLIASGPIDYADYFNTEVKPLLDDKRTVIPPLDISTKGNFLSHAKCVLMPVTWEEPFGLVAVEAMACGTPVIAFKSGGLKETIIDGVTGFLVNTVEEMAEKIKMIDQIDRAKCLDHVKNNFSARVMAKNYLRYYQDIMKIV